MALTGDRTYVGFGFGAIQAGLFLYEAWRSGHFKRLVVVEVLPNVVDHLRDAGGVFSLNIAHADRIETVQVGPVEIWNPSVAGDRERIAAALGDAHEIGTAIPSVALYISDGAGSLHYILAGGLIRKVLRGGPRAVVYTAENNNTAAENLGRLVLGQVPEQFRDRVRKSVQVVNTVIGKMSGIVDHGELHLPPAVPGGTRAFLVESFNQILISKINFPFERGLDVFIEKENLLPFEEAKLYGHNATHALAGYLGRLLGVRKMSDLPAIPGVMPFLRDAFLLESGEPLVHKYAGADDLFTPAGYAAFADDLLARMTNPFLMDLVERVCRDPQRKLAWDDRLIGTMRLALSQGILPHRYAIGAAAAFAALHPGFLDGQVGAAELAADLWQHHKPSSSDRDAVLALVKDGAQFLHDWRSKQFPNLQDAFSKWSMRT
jgi:mannitol-1-phosphate 5-dehydrogenase